MADVTRRGFLTQVSIATGVGMAGGLGLHRWVSGGAPITTAAAPAPGPAPLTPARPLLDGVTLAGPMLVHVRDVASGEIALMVGTRELIYRDPELVSRLVRTAAAAGTAEG